MDSSFTLKEVPIKKGSASRLRDQFIDDALIRGSSSETIRSYRCHIKPFIDYVGALELNPLEVDCRNLKDFLRAQMDRRLSIATINDYIRTFKHFYRWAIAEGYLEKDPSESIKKLKEPRREKPVLSPEGMARLLSYCSIDTFHGLRNRAILSLMWDCGLRRAEVLSARLDELDLEKLQLAVIGKGNKAATVYLSAKTAEALKSWLEIRGADGSQYLFTNENGQGLKNDFLTHMIIKLGRKAGIRVYPHLIRHSVITWLAEQGMDPFSLQAYARHEDLNTTMRYVQRARLAQRLPAELRRFSPGDKI
jgi:integrase/recombinase XerD